MEDRLHRIIRGARDLSSTSVELRRAITDWPSNYHLHPRRSNLLRPIRHLLRGTVLEIGAGCGAITRFLGETQARVLALEPGARRAAVAASRCRDLPNVAVVADSLDHFSPRLACNAIILVGVLEYARRSFLARSQDATSAMLRRAREFLQPGGILVVAIENQLGLKYFCGYPEDHTGNLAMGIEDRYPRDGVATFGRAELAEKLRMAGFAKFRWWYPFPDYKLPVSIISEAGLAAGMDLHPLVTNALAADVQNPGMFLYSQEQIYGPVIRNGMLPDLANSFLVIASEADIPGDSALAFHFSSARRPEYAKELRFQQNGSGIVVRAQRLFPKTAPSANPPLQQNLQDEPLAQGTQWSQELLRILNRPAWRLEEVQAWLGVWLEAMLPGHQYTSGKAKIGAASPFRAADLIPGDRLDALPHNLFVSAEGETKFIDQEWRLDQPVELGHMIYRAVMLSWFHVRSCAAPAPGTPVYLLALLVQAATAIGVPLREEDLQRYSRLEQEFALWITGIDELPSFDNLKRMRLPIRPDLRYIAGHADVLRRQERQRQERQTGKPGDPGQPKPAPVGIFSAPLRSLLEAGGKLLYWTLTLQLPRRLRRRRLCRQLLASGLFDAEFYLRQYPDVAACGMNPLIHFLNIGAARDYDPNPYFDTAFYAKTHSELRRSKINPLVHYLQHGLESGNEPSAFFSGELYCRWYPEVRESGCNPLSHFLLRGRVEGKRPPIISAAASAMRN